VSKSIFFLLAIAVSSLATAASVPLTGEFGAAQGSLLLDRTGGTLTLGCAHATLDAPIRPATNGRFNVAMKFETYRPGPQRDDQSADVSPARLKGVVNGDDVRLTVIRRGTAPLVMEFERNRAARVVRCY
jgi:hypothetical protein